MEAKRITANEIITECQQGSMTTGRLIQIMTSLYEDGWRDRNSIQRKWVIKKAKMNLSSLSDAIDDTVFDKADEIYEKVNELVRYTSASVLGAAVALVSNKGIHLTPDEVASCLSKIDSDKIQSIKTEIEKMADAISKNIDLEYEDDKTTAE